MNRKKAILLTSLFVLIPMIVGLILWNQLPEEIPVHFNSAGEPDNYESKAFAVFFIPAFLWAMHLLAGFVTLADPKKQNISNKMFLLVLCIVPACSVFATLLMYTAALDISVSVNMIGNLFLGIVLLAVGNYLPKSRQNYTIGVKLPWTLNDTENWNKTHRFAGILWIICGVILIINAFLDIIWIIPASIGVAVLLPTAYSFLLFVKKTGSNEDKGDSVC